MSNILLRRNSSKQGLQNLMRLTAQRSLEDAEEAERERRRRAREALSRQSSSSGPENDDGMYDSELKPSRSSSLEEDEGFGEWTQRREQKRHQQQRQQEMSQQNEEEHATGTRQRGGAPDCHSPPSGCIPRRAEEEQQHRSTVGRMEEVEVPDIKAQRGKDVEVFSKSKALLNQGCSNRDADEVQQGVTSSAPSRTWTCSSKAHKGHRPVEAMETDQRLEKIRRNHQEKESQELQQLRQRQKEAERELRREERQAREGEEPREPEKELTPADNINPPNRWMTDLHHQEHKRRMESLSCSTGDGEETSSNPNSKATPSHRVTDWTESLHRSLKKSFKKTPPPILLSSIDLKREQYAQAAENSQELRSALKPTDLPDWSYAVTARKSLFEAGEASSSSRATSKVSAGQDTELPKVGVACRISQWVQSASHSSSKPLAKAADVKPGDVMQKRNMWEGIRGSSVLTHSEAKASMSGTKYKFLVTRHGKYEKISLKEES